MDMANDAISASPTASKMQVV